VGLRASACRFAHGARYVLPRSLALYDSYHCSRYNTQTRRLTPEMFSSVVACIAGYLAPENVHG
jgi:uracil-DNA glycosylase